MSIDNLLSRLEKVKSHGNGKWIACCPSHEDKSPSLSIAETSEGVILLHCFGGCDTHSVLSSIGLEFADIYPEKLQKSHKSRKRKWSANQICELGSVGMSSVALMLERMQQQCLTPEEFRLLKEDMQMLIQLFNEAKYG